MISDAARHIIEDWRLGFVATINEDGTPNLSPKGTFIVVDDDTIAFGEMRSPNTMANIAHNNAVAVNFVDNLSRKGVRIAGTTRVAEKGSEAFNALYPQFHAIWGDALGGMFNAIVMIDVASCKPMQSPAYETGAQHKELCEQWFATISAIHDKHTSNGVCP